MTITLDGTLGITTPTYGGAVTAEYSVPVTGFKNRIINGGMVIDQRNAGAALTVNSGTDFYPVDRFIAVGTAASGVFTVQRSSTAPTGFINSLLATVTTADASIVAADQYYVSQLIEGLNVADLAWGTASAATVALSFWVNSSLTGTYGGSIRNSATDRSYPFTYTISVANTWEQKTVTIAGDTSGTWLTTSGTGLQIVWSLGMGTTRLGTAGAWASGNYKSATGSTNWISTGAATFYITGVQLEKGSTATSFDFRAYSTELAMCQRYYYKTNAAAGGSQFGVGFCSSTTAVQILTPFQVTMRTNPTALEQSGTAGDYRVLSSAGNTTCNAVPSFQEAGFYSARTNLSVASGLTTGQGAMSTAVNTSAYLGWSAEL